MSFTTVMFFFCFLPATLVLYHVLSVKLRNVFLLLASLAFFSYGSAETLLYLIVCIAVNYCAALLMTQLSERLKARRMVMTAAVLFNVGGLFYYKYLAYTMGLFNNWFGIELAVPSIALPIGLSFFTFRAVSYICDTYFDTVPANRNFINTALYISFFPQLLSGPITKYADFEEAFQPEKRRLSLDGFADGIWLFVIGAAKKVIISNNIAPVVDMIYNLPASERPVFYAWAGALGYMIQLYFDFGGYSDMARGLSAMFGFPCANNFDYPYISKSIGEYWRRWHITLGQWFRDYMYMPVFRAFTTRRVPMFAADVCAMAVVWLATGIWHGAGIQYPLYGIMWFLIILIERIIEDKGKAKRKQLGIKRKPPESIPVKIFKHLYVIVAVIIIQVIFRAPSLAAAWEYIRSMFGASGNQLMSGTKYFVLQNFMIYTVGIIFSLPLIPWLTKKLVKKEWGVTVSLYTRVAVAAVLLILALSGIVAGTYNSFIYFQF